MALHFTTEEFQRRNTLLQQKMQARGLDAMLLFAPESHFWLTGYDTFGYCFFQCLICTADGNTTLLTRSADLRQAQITSIIKDIRIWKDAAGANPANDLRDVLESLGLKGSKLGVEYDTHGLTAFNGKRVDAALEGFVTLEDHSPIIHDQRVVKSDEEIAKVRRAAELADDALDAGLAIIGQGADEGDILNAMQGAVFTGGGDYPANEFIIGSAEAALLCRYKTGRRKLSANDQLTLEWAGAYHHYHAAMMNTVVIGTPTAHHIAMHAAAAEAIAACKDAMQVGNTFGDVFAAHARVMDAHGMHHHKLNACGYTVGARYSPSWMDGQMFYENNPFVIEPNMSLFAHMILMDSDSGCAMTLGETFITTENGPEALSRHGHEMLLR